MNVEEFVKASLGQTAKLDLKTTSKRPQKTTLSPQFIHVFPTKNRSAGFCNSIKISARNRSQLPKSQRNTTTHHKSW